MPGDATQQVTIEAKDGSKVVFLLPKNQKITAATKDSLKKVLTSYQIEGLVIKKQDSSFPSEFMLPVFFAFIILLFFYESIFSFLNKLWLKVFSKKELEKINILLEQNLPYYKKLSITDKEKFTERVFKFNNNIRFEFKHNCTNQKDTCYFIATSAIQLTFGLTEYLFDGFKRIVVYGQAYSFGEHQSFMGHIQQHEIHLSWNDYLHGYQIGNDKHNVGLHEMAHALTHQTFKTKGTIDEHFANSFKQYSKIARPLFNNKADKIFDVLGYYAATNYHEFWAVSVEVFFEQPLEMYNANEALYKAMCNLLKQNPLDI